MKGRLRRSAWHGYQWCVRREGLIYVNEENWDVIYSQLIKHKINSKFHLELSINSSILVKENMSLSVPSFSPTGLPVFLR